MVMKGWLMRMIEDFRRRKPKPYCLMWNSHIPTGICLRCQSFETPEQREKFRQALEKDPDFMGYVDRWEPARYTIPRTTTEGV